MNIITINTHYQKYGVEYVNLYIPSINVDLHCVGFGCKNINFYSQHGMKNEISNISFNICNQECISSETCINNWQLYCNDFSEYKTAIFTGSSCNNDRCDCNDLKNQIQQAWIDSNLHECDSNTNTNISKPDIICEEDKSVCVIDCNIINCRHKIIYGYKATSLTVKCDNSYKCEYVDIYCPDIHNINSECTINCNDHESCYGMTIYGNTNNNINLQCLSIESCANANVYGEESRNINIKCYGMKDIECYDTIDDNKCYSSDSACYNLKIYASYVTNTINLECHDQFGCYYTDLYASNANNVKVLGNNGYGGMQYTYIFVENVSDFELTCIGSSISNGCYYANIYLNDLIPKNNHINCFGFGCSYLYLYVSNGMKTLGQSNILLNSCGSNVCNSPHECIDEWYVYCNDWKNNIQPFDTNIIFYGESCANKDRHHCDCQSYVNILTNVFINDSSMTQCDIINNNNIIIKTTEWIDNDKTTSNNSESNIHSKHGHGWIIFIILISCILFICIITNIFYCKYKSHKLKIAHEKLKEHEEEGDIDVADIAQMFPENNTQTTTAGLTTSSMDGIDKNNKNKKESYVSLNNDNNDDNDDNNDDDVRDGQTTGAITGLSTYALASQ